MKLRAVAAAGAVAALGAFLAVAPGAGAATFTNPSAITTSQLIQGTADPYPAQLTVSGVNGALSTVSLTLNGLTTNGVKALEVALVGPDGTGLQVMRRVGDNFTPVADVTYKIEDSALAQFPAAGGPPSGAYKPTNRASGPPMAPDDPFDSPACPISPLLNPGPSSVGSPAGTMASFAGKDPNGTWSLCVRNIFDGTGATIARGFSLDVTPVAEGPSGQRAAALKKCKKKKSKMSKKKRKKCLKRAKKLPL